MVKMGSDMVGRERVAYLERLLKRAGACAYSYFGSAQVSHKADGSLVTDADKVAEEVLLEGLTEAFPGYGVRGEEGAHVDGERGTWYVDPLDGTSAFVQLLAHWGPTVCLVEDGELVLGAFWLPRLRRDIRRCGHSHFDAKNLEAHVQLAGGSFVLESSND